MSFNQKVNVQALTISLPADSWLPAYQQFEYLTTGRQKSELVHNSSD